MKVNCALCERYRTISMEESGNVSCILLDQLSPPAWGCQVLSAVAVLEVIVMQQIPRDGHVVR